VVGSVYQITFSGRQFYLGDPDKDETTTGKTYPLEDIPNSWSLVDLHGCTSVIVISRKQMYMTHIWKGPTMNEPWTDNMRTQALDPLRNDEKGTPGLQQFAVPGGDFENIPETNVRAFILTRLPIRGDFNQPIGQIRYTNEVGQIKVLLEDILGHSDTTTISYVSTSPDHDFESASGKRLIQYDPVNQWTEFEGLCDIQNAGIELWFEDLPLYRYQIHGLHFSTKYHFLIRSLVGQARSDRKENIGALAGVLLHLQPRKHRRLRRLPRLRILPLSKRQSFLHVHRCPRPGSFAPVHRNTALARFPAQRHRRHQLQRRLRLQAKPCPSS
jgi:hypothetical protein